MTLSRTQQKRYLFGWSKGRGGIAEGARVWASSTASAILPAFSRQTALTHDQNELPHDMSGIVLLLHKGHILQPGIADDVGEFCIFYHILNMCRLIWYALNLGVGFVHVRDDFVRRGYLWLAICWAHRHFSLTR